MQRDIDDAHGNMGSNMFTSRIGNIMHVQQRCCKRLMHQRTHVRRITLGQRSIPTFTRCVLVRLIARLVEDEPDVGAIGSDKSRLLYELVCARDILTCGAEPIHAAVERSTNKMVTS